MEIQPIIKFEKVSFAYNGKNVLENVNFEICQGDFIAMIGPNGGGKTTILKLILGLLKPNSGKINIKKFSQDKANANVGYVPQELNINQNFPITALDIVLMGSLNGKKLWHRITSQTKKEAIGLLDQLGMKALANNKISQLSGGQRQRVFIARALMMRPKLLLLDEPTASIDPKGQVDFYQMLRDLNKDLTIVVVSHDLLVISTYVKSVACVNKHLYHHKKAEITGEMLDMMYSCKKDNSCPVELIAHGLPHRVLKDHHYE